MIIYGTRGREVVIDGGEFHCPNCDREEEYDLMAIKTYFTLYFIPIFPVSTAGTFVKCLACEGEFKESVLD